nr:hypothetical protein [Tanacetum cinerariifolium]
MNMSSANKVHFEAEKEAIHLILTGIGDEIYSTVDACQTAQEMWEAIKRLQQGSNSKGAKFKVTFPHNSVSRRIRNGRLRLSLRNIGSWNRNRNNQRLDMSAHLECLVESGYSVLEKVGFENPDFRNLEHYSLEHDNL